MSLAGKRIGFGLTGSHHTYSKAFEVMEKLVAEQVDVVPIVSDTVMNMDTKFGKGPEHIEKIEAIAGKKVISTIPDAEPLGPDYPLDCMIIAPLTGNSLSKLANAHTDNAVLMAAKSTMRNENPVVLGITTNDALGLNGVNLMKLMNSKHIYFIPFGQDNPFKKPNSLVADLNYLEAAVTYALQGKQLQPIIIPFIR
ncbi:dipicolinate synthase subunit B [Oceanobacillus chungangensis]|uniref:Dipicolinate synthase subunit B n=1 Tax=Oceanobacillus chungangensis TaxID=1229152 RepID=A0A3D8PR96_9BACI|nr:dipicolinate synthase subunit B [Oceanobacillus chungangensis]RDW17788.1 dipicolinate synthase subunit B [Oceanobacillus chungangensis]